MKHEIYMVAARRCHKDEQTGLAHSLAHCLDVEVSEAVAGVDAVSSGAMIYRLLVPEDDAGPEAVKNTHLAQLFREGFQYNETASALLRITIERI